MTTAKQIAANQANALKGTGPKTPEGKAKSSMNSETHGLLSQHAVMSGEDSDEFEALRMMLWEEFKPSGGYEETLVDDLAGRYWRLARISLIESNIMHLARYEIQHRIAQKKFKEADPLTVRSNDPLNMADLSPTYKDLKDKAQAAKAKAEKFEMSFGGAFLHNVKNGDPLSKLARHETRIRNEIRKIIEELEGRQEKRRKRESANAGVNDNSVDGTPAVIDVEDSDETGT
jgi:hypothetical protein